MDGAFPHYYSTSNSTMSPSYNINHHKQQQPLDTSLLFTSSGQLQQPMYIHYNGGRNSVDESLLNSQAIMKYSTSSNGSSSSSNSSRQSSSYSPPNRTASSTPQRVPRKPVSNNPVVASTFSSSPKPLQPSQHQQKHQQQKQQHRNSRNYHAADTVHPNRMRTYSQVGPTKPATTMAASTIIPSPSPSLSTITASSTSSASSKDRYVRTRRHSQGSSLVSANTKSSLSDTSSIVTISTTSSKTFWYPRDRDFEPLEPLKRGLSKKIRGLLQPHKTQIEQESACNNAQYMLDCQKSLKRSKTPNFINHEQNPFRILR